MNIEQNRALHNFLIGIESKWGMPKSIFYTNPLSVPIKVFGLNIKGSYESHLKLTIPSSGSVAPDIMQASLGGFGEWFERYSICIPFPASKTVSFSIQNRPEDIQCLNLEELAELQSWHPFQFHLVQNEIKRIKADTVLKWIQGKYLSSNKNVWVPADFCIMRNRQESYFISTSNGCALSSTYDNAVTRASLELIERDCFMSFWWRMEKPEFIDYREDLKELDPQMYRAFGPWLKNIHVIYHPRFDGVPTFFTVFKSTNKVRHPSFLFCAAAALDPHKALRRSLCEMASMLNHKLFHADQVIKKNTQISNFDQNFRTFDDHHLHYGTDDMAKSVYFIDQLNHVLPTKKLRDIENLESQTDEENLGLLKRKFSAMGLNPVVVDQTPEDVRSLGFHAVRVLDPKAIDLNPSHSLRPWGKSRLYCNQIRSIYDLNQFPHPFP